MRAALLLSLALAAPAAAQPVVLAPSGCHLRLYDAAHLAAHPAQRVRAIALRVLERHPEVRTVILEVMVALRDRADVYTGAAWCDVLAGGSLDCGMEGDAGSFTLTGARGGALRLAVGPYGISFEGARDFVTLDSDRGDDRVFLLPPAPAGECR